MGPAPDQGASDAGAPDAGAPNVDAGTDAGLPPGGEDPFELCPNGEVVHYSLAPLASPPAPSALEFSGLPSGVQIFSVSDAAGVRFELCQEGGALSLQGILWEGPSNVPTLFRSDESISAPEQNLLQLEIGTVFEVRFPASDWRVQGLEEALSGDLDPLEVRVLGEFGMLALGHEGYIAMVTGRVDESSIEYNSIAVTVGALVPGDSFEDRRCPLGEMPHDASFNLGSARFEVQTCTFQAAGHTTGYRIAFLAVQDDSPALSADAQQRFVFDSEEAVEGVMNYVWNHHNACDSFFLDLPHADYAATTAPLAGCGVAVDNAPMRDLNDDPTTILYRVRYGDGAWEDRTATDCSHYIFCNR